MGIGASIALIALGAILRYAVTATVSGISIAAVGAILMIVGFIGLVISLVMMLMYGARGDVVVEEEPVVERRVYREPGLY